MKREDIEMAAERNTEEYVKNGDLRGFRGSYRLGFIAGADWRINSVWHTMDVVPEREVLLALHGYGRTITIKWNGDMKWKGMDKFFRAEKWAYVEDFLPNKEE